MHDLDAAVEFYCRLGFQVGARNRHPRAWGTQNHIVQLPGTFIELLSVADESGIEPHVPRRFSFGAFNRDFLAHNQGPSMLVLAGRGAADAHEFHCSGIGDFELCEIEREAKRPDGTAVKVAFALAFAVDSKAPETGFFTCLHRHPEYFWNPAFQVHINTATAVAGVALVAARPSRHESFLAAFTGAGTCKAMPGGIAVQTERGDIQVVTPAAFGDLYGVAPPDVLGGLRLAALRFAVRDRGAAKSIFEQAKIPVTIAGNAIVLGSHAAMGAVLVFDR